MKGGINSMNIVYNNKQNICEFIEVAYECRKQKKHRVFSHEGFWKPVPQRQNYNLQRQEQEQKER